ncbi:MAG: hypothetical protein ACK4IK_02485 [Bacteroidia bacterium]
MQNIYKLIPWFIAAWTVLMLASLKLGWLDSFFWAAENAQVQGIDYFALPKSYLNLLEGRSAFDTWGGETYGPYATWYLGHPAFSVFVMFWFSFFSPWVSYAAFVIFSLSLLIYSAHHFSKLAANSYEKVMSYFLLLCAFPVYWMLYVGNMHAPLVLAMSLLLIAVYEMLYGNDDKSANQKLLVGLLISFLSKPIVILMLPALLLVCETRKSTFQALSIYVAVSVLFIIVPTLNPEGIGMARLLNTMFDFEFIKENMNIYKNKFVLNEYMKDNAIHWLNLIAQSEHRLNHIEVFSLPVFIDSMMEKQMPASIYKWPIHISLLLSATLFFIRDKKARLTSLMLLLSAISLTFYLSYNTVWEYQYASLMPVIALLYFLRNKGIFTKVEFNTIIALSIFFYLPSFYFLLPQKEVFDLTEFNIIRFNRVIPALLLFLVLSIKIARIVVSNFQLRKPDIYGYINSVFFN